MPRARKALTASWLTLTTAVLAAKVYISAHYMLIQGQACWKRKFRLVLEFIIGCPPALCRGRPVPAANSAGSIRIDCARLSSGFLPSLDDEPRCWNAQLIDQSRVDGVGMRNRAGTFGGWSGSISLSTQIQAICSEQRPQLQEQVLGPETKLAMKNE